MSNLIFSKVEPKNAPILISLASRSGGGKTYSALRLARGLVGDKGKIFVADTESGRASHYSNEFDFQGIELFSPFTSQSHIDVIEAAEKQGADVLIIDTMSHEWSGIGGVCETAEKIIGNNPSKMLPAWAKAKAPHKRLVHRMVQSSMHIIVCLRAEHKCVTYRDDDNKLIITETEDLIPEQEKRFIYEMTVSAVIDEKTHKATFIKLPEPVKNTIKSGQMIDEKTGEALRAWVESGFEVEDDYPKIYHHAQGQAYQGMAAYQDFFLSLNSEDKKRLNDSGDHEKFKNIAKGADEDARGNEDQNDNTDPDNIIDDFFGVGSQKQEDTHV